MERGPDAKRQGVEPGPEAERGDYKNQKLYRPLVEEAELVLRQSAWRKYRSLSEFLHAAVREKIQQERLDQVHAAALAQRGGPVQALEAQGLPYRASPKSPRGKKR